MAIGDRWSSRSFGHCGAPSSRNHARASLNRHTMIRALGVIARFRRCACGVRARGGDPPSPRDPAYPPPRARTPHHLVIVPCFNHHFRRRVGLARAAWRRSWQCAEVGCLVEGGVPMTKFDDTYGDAIDSIRENYSFHNDIKIESYDRRCHAGSSTHETKTRSPHETWQLMQPGQFYSQEDMNSPPFGDLDNDQIKGHCRPAGSAMTVRDNRERCYWENVSTAGRGTWGLACYRRIEGAGNEVPCPGPGVLKEQVKVGLNVVAEFGQGWFAGSILQVGDSKCQCVPIYIHIYISSQAPAH